MEAAEALLAAMRLGPAPSCTKTDGINRDGNRYSSPASMPTSKVAKDPSASPSAHAVRAGGGLGAAVAGVGARGGSNGTATPRAADGSRSRPSTSNVESSKAKRFSVPQPAPPATSAAPRSGGSVGVKSSEGNIDVDGVNDVLGSMHRERLKATAAYHREYQAARTAFAKLDQNSGRVSTPAFEDLLTLLCIPEDRRRGDATESARASGLLSSYSFSCEQFTSW